MKLTQKYLPALVMLFLALFLSGTASMAAPGCDPEVLEAMQNHAKSIEVRDRAYAQQIFKQNDNSLGMTCYDKALASTVKLGQVFSDRPPLATAPLRNDSIFGTSSYPSFGLDRGDSSSLLTAVQGIIIPIATGHTANFTASVSALLGAVAMGYLNNLAGQLRNALRGFSLPGGYLTTINNVISTINTIYSALQVVLALLGTALPTIVTQVINTINTLWPQIRNLLQSGVRTALAAILAILAPIIQAILNSIFGVHPQQSPCDLIAQRWGKKVNGQQVPPWFVNPIVGNGPERGTPYFNIKSLLSGNILGAGSELMRAIGNNSGAGKILDRALQDISPGGRLSGPGVLPTWTNPINLPPNSTAACVRRVITGQQTSCP